jgi:hypothetical protein
MSESSILIDALSSVLEFLILAVQHTNHIFETNLGCDRPLIVKM